MDAGLDAVSAAYAICEALKRLKLSMGKNFNVVGVLSEDKMLTTALFDGTVNTDVFEAWLQQGLLPVLPNGAIV